MSRPVTAYIHLPSLRHNYRLLDRLAGKASVMAVVKADAYGHGLHLVAPALMLEGCMRFAVTDAEEGERLRDIIGNGPEITLLSGIFDTVDARRCVDVDLTPALTDSQQVGLLQAAGFTGQAWLKVDTGMRRLGAADACALHSAIETAGIGTAGLMSHLACADEPGHALNDAQVQAFNGIRSNLPEGLPASLLNSAGLVSLNHAAFDVVRPGIALYGAEPLNEHPVGLKPVMRLCSRVMQLRQVSRGESVSYGATFTANKNMSVATMAIGYADGLPRLLSNRGYATTCGGKGTAILPIVGRVCMDYCLLDASSTNIGHGTEVEFWGEHQPATQVAESIGTIAYELFTGVNARVPRLAIE